MSGVFGLLASAIVVLLFVPLDKGNTMLARYSTLDRTAFLESEDFRWGPVSDLDNHSRLENRNPGALAGEESDSALYIRTVGSERAMTTIRGVRITRGNAVDCPRIRGDDGAIHVVSYLSSRISVGARVEVRGFYAITTTCRGTVLVVEDEYIVNN